jgi:5-methylcytosine-specific restriction endonuclease McrA
MSKTTRIEWYAEYLKSPHWVATRDAKIASLDHLRCERCGEWGRRDIDGVTVGLHVHHLTYERVPGKERLEDLQVLCIACHQEQHGTPLNEHERDLIRRRISSAIDRRGTVPDRHGEDHIAEELAYVDDLIEQGYDL